MMQRPESGQDHHAVNGQQPLNGILLSEGDAKHDRPDQTLRKMILNQLNEWQIDTEIESAMLATKKNAKQNRS
jgi:hypothetical protein